MREGQEFGNVKGLGNQGTEYKYAEPTKDTLETFINKHQTNDYLVDFKCPEFTSLCPKTGQPDFATIHISYVPNVNMVESKSLKLYLFSYRNHGDFHEDCTNKIMKDLVSVMEPKWIRVVGDFTPRGGISIAAVAEYTQPGFKVPEHYLKVKNIHTRHE
jgi:7-cyano-7-deazaguanine reductase